MSEQIKDGGLDAADSGRVDEILAHLKDPANVHVMMLRGVIAVPSIRSMVDLRGEVPNGEDVQLARIAELQEQLAAQGQGEAVAYFSADPAEGEFSTHKSLAEAVAGAASLLAFAQDVASDDGWADEPPQICYGVVLGRCVEKGGSRRAAPEGSDFSEMVDFQLTEPRSAPPASLTGVPDGYVKPEEIAAYRRRTSKPRGTAGGGFGVFVSDTQNDIYSCPVYFDTAPTGMPDANRFHFIVKYNWIGTKTRCKHHIQDGDLNSARRAVDDAMLAAREVKS